MVKIADNISRFVFCLGCVASLLSLVAIENYTSSMPKGIYIRDYFGIDRGDVVTLPLPDAVRPVMERLGSLEVFDNGVLLLKYVAAIEGDTVCRNGDEITINGKLMGYALEKSPLNGFSLPTWQGCQTLDKDDVFVYTDYAPFSIDGRYFGVVSKSEARAYQPLITW